DSEIDNSYEGLLRLGERIGFAGPQHTPSSIINSLRRGIFSGFPNPGNETRCPICLDDYLPDVQVLAAYPCNHFYHSECLEQWLQSSRSCPNCRTRIQPPRSPTTAFARTENSIPSAPLNTNSLEQPVAHGGAPGGLREAMTSAETQTESMLGIENRVEEM
ncbi:uncharacterized protein EI90DRAFT_2926656, partial [Cantharellus anzutake]|uniref:uncharacterized protein n=1 Tax=Cantharellus anzutake TaxID=1750568 RepID=UPI001903388B